MNIVVIDNYDSFVYNLVHYLEALDCNVTVLRNNQFILEDLESFDKILLSPGPGIPDEAGLLKQVITHYAGKKPIFGVCLGHQAIGEVYGGTLINLKEVFHGVATPTKIIMQDPLFKDLPETIEVGRYHSWVVDKQQFPEVLDIVAVDENNEIMALRHKFFDVCGVQFHPESVLTPLGKQIIKNWINS